jgi:ADP-ribosylglycohydrolase
MKVVPVTCLYAGKPELAAKVEEAIRVHQNNDVAVAFGVAASCVLEAVLLGSSLGEALEKCASSSAEANIVAEAFATSKEAAGSLSLEELLVKTSNEMMKDNPDSPFYNLAARSCKLPGSFIVPLHQLYVGAHGSGEEVYVTAIRNNILGAGDTCSRAVIIGAILAAATGGPPDSWVAKMDSDTLAKVDAAAEAIATHAVSTCSESI